MAWNRLVEPTTLPSVFIVFVYPATLVYASDRFFANKRINSHTTSQLGARFLYVRDFL